MSNKETKQYACRGSNMSKNETRYKQINKQVIRVKMKQTCFSNEMHAREATIIRVCK